MNFVALTVIFIRLEYHDSIVAKCIIPAVFCNMKKTTKQKNQSGREYPYLTEVAHTNSMHQSIFNSKPHITLGPHEAGVWAKHPSLTLPAGESPADTLAPAISRGCPSCLHWLLTWVACGAHPCRSCMVAPRDYFQDDKEASGILKIIKS